MGRRREQTAGDEGRDEGTVEAQQPSAVHSLELQSIELARAMLAERRYMDARRTLYRLLAHADAAGLDERLVTEAEFLVAESYELQGRALAEAAR